VAGIWLIVRAFILGSYGMVEFAKEAGALSLLSAVVIAARLHRLANDSSSSANDATGFSAKAKARFAIAAVLFLAAIGCQLWWVTRISHGLFLKRLQFGLEPFAKLILCLWAACLVILPRPPRTHVSPQRERLRAAINVVAVVLLVWTYPYTDALTRYVQWSGLYLMYAAALAIWQVVAWLRCEAFVYGWLNWIAVTFVPVDFAMPAPATETGSAPRESRLPLALICAAAMAMQAINVSWGLPPDEVDRELRPIHPDEKVTYEQAWRLYFDPEPVTFVRGGSAYYRLGMFAKDLATYLTDPDFAQRLQILLLRWLNVVAIGGFVFMVYVSGRQLFDRRTGLLAALLAALFPGLVVTAHPARPEAIFAFLCAVGLHASIRAARGPASPQWRLVGGLILGVTVATKITGVGLIAPLLAALLLTKPSAVQFLVYSIQIGLMAAIGYVLASFETFFFFGRFLEGLAFTRNLQGARGAADFVQSVAAYLGPIAGFAWTVPGLVLTWIGVVVAARRRECLVVIAFLLMGHAISFAQRDVTLRSHVHLSGVAALLAANVLARAFDACRARPWLRRAVWTVEAAMILLIAQESLGHVAYLRFGVDSRQQASEWIEANVPPDRVIGLTPYFHGDWSSTPPLDELRRRVMYLPVSRIYDASDYKERDVDFVVLCDLTLEAPEISPEAADFFKFVQRGDTFRLVETFVPSFEAFHSAEWLGWRMHADWRLTRPTFYLYERRRVTVRAADSTAPVATEQSPAPGGSNAASPAGQVRQTCGDTPE